MRLLECRRIHGPHWLLPGPGAAAEWHAEEGDDVDGAVAQWSARATERMRSLGWIGDVVVRRHRLGASLALPAPVDLTMAATIVLEEAASEDVSHTAVDDEIRLRSRPALRQAVAWAMQSSVPWQLDDEVFTIGQGRNARSWQADQVPPVAELTPASAIRTILVTGTNGKTTTTRLLAHLFRRLGDRVGMTSSDGIQIDGQWVVRGDWSGPGAARRVLRDPLIETAILETARGGYLRRGLAVSDADVLVITNVAPDHLGEWGIDDVEAMVDCKLSMIRGLRRGAVVVVNEGCARLFERVLTLRRERADLRFTTFQDGPTGDLVCRNGAIISEARHVGDAVDLPITLGGRLPFNTQNALAAMLAARALGIDPSVSFPILCEFEPSADSSRGRANLYDLHGAIVLVDFAHTPDAVAELRRVARAGRGRSTMLLGQAGDRTDALIDELGRAAAGLGLDRYVLKGMPRQLRGRAPGEVEGRLRRALIGAGIPDDHVVEASDERMAAAMALKGARSGDRILLLVHDAWEHVVGDLMAMGARPLTRWPEG